MIIKRIEKANSSINIAKITITIRDTTTIITTIVTTMIMVKKVKIRIVEVIIADGIISTIITIKITIKSLDQETIMTIDMVVAHSGAEGINAEYKFN